jgi:hypothetical protein
MVVMDCGILILWWWKWTGLAPHLASFKNLSFSQPTDFFKKVAKPALRVGGEGNMQLRSAEFASSPMLEHNIASKTCHPLYVGRVTHLLLAFT